MKIDKFLEYAQKIKDNKSFNYRQEHKIVDKNGKIRWVEKKIIPLYEEDKHIEKIIVNFDITEKKDLEKLAITDGLTGLYNRRYFNEILNREVCRAIRAKSLLSFSIIDIDFFKQYNDNYGHDAGDKALINVANVIKKSAKRGSDFAFRVGGEEFGILFGGCDKDHSLMFIQKIIQNVRNLHIPHSNSKVDKYVTISAGVVVVDFQKESVDKNGLYTIADDALYQAKKAGRNRVVLHENDDLEFF